MQKLPLAGLCAACFLASSLAVAADPCVDHFTSEGGFFSGKKYATWDVFPSVKTTDAYSRAYAFTAANGFTINSGDREAGVISATQTVSYGKGKTVPLNIIIQKEGVGSKVQITYATSGGVSSPDDAVQEHFCKTMAAVAAK